MEDTPVSRPLVVRIGDTAKTMRSCSTMFVSNRIDSIAMQACIACVFSVVVAILALAQGLEWSAHTPDSGDVAVPPGSEAGRTCIDWRCGRQAARDRPITWAPWRCMSLPSLSCFLPSDGCPTFHARLRTACERTPHCRGIVWHIEGLGHRDHRRLQYHSRRNSWNTTLPSAFYSDFMLIRRL